jgi:hypothetical protein
MANEQHLNILALGVSAWNKWRKEHPRVKPNLSRAKLTFAELREIDFHNTNLNGVNLSRATLVDGNFTDAVLTNSDLSGTNLARANFEGANLEKARLSICNMGLTKFRKANLSNAHLLASNFILSDLSYANLSEANLSRTSFHMVVFEGADLSRARLVNSVFARCDLSEVIGLDKVKHDGPSSVDLSTIYSSRGKIPEVFLKGVGFPDTFIVYAQSLVEQPIQFYSCFISYSSKDQSFAERLYADLQNKGVRCWFAPVDLRIGDEIRVGIDESIRVHDKLLLVLSKHSIESEWVKKEVETAFEREQKQKRRVLFPIRLDDTVMKVESGWPADIKRTRHIGDFRKWKDHDAYQVAFQRLLRDLEAKDASEGRA